MKAPHFLPFKAMARIGIGVSRNILKGVFNIFVLAISLIVGTLWAKLVPSAGRLTHVCKVGKIHCYIIFT